jgi:hypothetical protein
MAEETERKSAALRLAEEIQRRPFAAAAIAGGAAAAAAGAFIGARALARRNGVMNPVLATAITAQEVAHAAAETGEEREAEAHPS